jgi:hypothetical protein
MHSLDVIIAATSQPVVYAGPNIFLGLVMAVLGGRESERFAERYGRTPWGWSTALWAIICFICWPVGAVLLFFARRSTARNLEAERTRAHAAVTSANWFADPTGRHQLRYFDGAQWTHHVQDQGSYAKDSMEPARVDA